MPKGGVERHNTATRQLYDKKYPRNREFRGVDGEGGNVPDPDALFGERHHYLSLRVGPELLKTGRPLTWEDARVAGAMGAKTRELVLRLARDRKPPRGRRLAGPIGYPARPAPARDGEGSGLDGVERDAPDSLGRPRLNRGTRWKKLRGSLSWLS